MLVERDEHPGCSSTSRNNKLEAILTKYLGMRCLSQVYSRTPDRVAHKKTACLWLLTYLNLQKPMETILKKIS
jgi:hypothetical protein